MSSPQDRARVLAQPEYAARRRAVIRLNHPDVGGDPEVLHAELARLDREFASRRVRPASSERTGVGGAARTTRFVVTPTPRWKRLRRTAIRGIARARSRLPRSIPGSRRYFDI